MKGRDRRRRAKTLKELGLLRLVGSITPQPDGRKLPSSFNVDPVLKQEDYARLGKSMEKPESESNTCPVQVNSQEK